MCLSPAVSRGAGPAPQGGAGEGSYPKPSISLSPGGMIPVGGNVTIRCQYQRLGMRIQLYKAGDGNYLTYTDPAGSEAEFPITSARREHGGSYTCRYSNRTGPAAYSEPSDPVQIIVAGEGPYPAPRLPASHPARAQGISVSPDPAEGTPGQRAGMESLGCSPTGGSSRFWRLGAGSLPRPSIFLSPTSVTALSSASPPRAGSTEGATAALGPRGLGTYGTLRARLCPEPRGVTGGFPSKGGAAAAGDLGLRGAPGLQTSVPTLGTHRRVRAQGLLSQDSSPP
uniref:Ig-like domain-containing protein n=1 Tax=Terrapene triunguis TaxID=2587831 RepID=A0A674IVB7_9SAUR